jgi:hypothetical protein
MKTTQAVKQAADDVAALINPKLMPCLIFRRQIICVKQTIFTILSFAFDAKASKS